MVFSGAPTEKPCSLDCAIKHSYPSSLPMLPALKGTSSRCGGAVCMQEVCMCTCVCAHALCAHRLLTGHLQQLLGGTSTAVIQHLAAHESISHTHFLYTEMFHLSSLKTFTMLSKCPLWWKWWQYFLCVLILLSLRSYGAAENSPVRMKVQPWEILHSNHFELWTTPGLLLFFLAVM